MTKKAGEKDSPDANGWLVRYDTRHMLQNITIIGDGAMATVVAMLLDSTQARVTVWGGTPKHIDAIIQTRRNERYLPAYELPSTIRWTSDPAAAMADAQMIVNAIPTQYIRTVWTKLAPQIAPRYEQGVGIVSLAKGIETGTLLRPTQVIQDVLESERNVKLGREEGVIVALSGPSVADELARGLPTTVCAAGRDEAFTQQVQERFTTKWLRVYRHSDILGVELAGATKNVIAVAAGILDGLHAGNNAKSALLTRGLAEVARLGVAMGAQQETFFGLTGVGDLATTCFSPTGRNRTCGELLGRGMKLADALKQIPGVVEGVPTTQAVLALAAKHQVEMPITQALHQVLFEGLDPLEGISRLMSRELKPERIGR